MVKNSRTKAGLFSKVEPTIIFKLVTVKDHFSTLSAWFCALLLAGCAFEATAQAATVRNAHASNCLDASDNPGFGKPVMATACANTRSQQFSAVLFAVTADGAQRQIYALRHEAFCIKPAGPSRSDLVLLGPCDASAAVWQYTAQFGRFVWQGAGQNRGMCMDMSLTSGTSARRPVSVDVCRPETEWGARNQDWFEHQ